MSVKLLGFVNTVVMARILMPEDYGVVALSMLIVGLVQAMLDFGAVTALMRKQILTQDDIDSAWTLRLIQCTVAASLISLAPIVAVPIFEETRITYVLWTIAASLAVMGMSSLGPEIANKEFNFALEFKIATVGKLVSVAATIVAGIWFRDYRALVLGIAAGYILPFFLTYAWSPIRHRINFSKVPEIWMLTKWLLIANVGSFVLRKGDELAAAKIGDSKEYGYYNVGSDLGALPVAEIGPAMLKALLPVLSTMQADAKRTNLAITKTLAALGALIWPLGLGMYATAPLVTEVLLGPKWKDAAIFVAVYGVVTVLQTLAMPLKTLLTLRAYTKIQSQLVWIEFLIFIVVACVLVPGQGVVGLVWSRLVASVINLAFTLYAAAYYCELRVLEVIGHIVRPAVGSMLMAYSVVNIPFLMGGVHVQLIASILVGAVIYGAWMAITWLLSGKPEGLESSILDGLSKKL